MNHFNLLKLFLSKMDYQSTSKRCWQKSIFFQIILSDYKPEFADKVMLFLSKSIEFIIEELRKENLEWLDLLEQILNYNKPFYRTKDIKVEILDTKSGPVFASNVFFQILIF